MRRTYVGKIVIIVTLSSYKLQSFSVLTDSSRLIAGVDDDDALVAFLDVDERAVDVLLQLARVDVDLVVRRLLCASAASRAVGLL